MDGENRGSVTTFINEGFLNNENTVERPNYDRAQSRSNLGLLDMNRRHENAHRNRPNDGNSTISAGIRDFALGYAETSRRQQPQETTKPKFYNGCIILSTIVLLLAPIAISVYVFIEHQRIATCATSSEGPSINPSRHQSGVDDELKKLVDEVKELHAKYQQLQIRVTQSDGSFTDLRGQRQARRQNCSSQISQSQGPSQASLDSLESKFTDRARQIRFECWNRIGAVKNEIRTIKTELHEETSNCKFEVENNTEVDNARNVQKVQINESKNGNAQFVGVTCCNEYTALNVSNAILEVNETASNIAYACYCAVGQKCNICYWQCGGSGDISHHIK